MRRVFFEELLITPECTIQLHCFQTFLCMSKYRIKQRQTAQFIAVHILNLHFKEKVGLPHSDFDQNMYCFSHCSFKYCFNQCHNARVSVLDFNIFPAFPNHFKYRHHTHLTILVFIVPYRSKFKIPSQCMLQIN